MLAVFKKNSRRPFWITALLWLVLAAFAVLLVRELAVLFGSAKWRFR